MFTYKGFDFVILHFSQQVEIRASDKDNKDGNMLKERGQLQDPHFLLSQTVWRV